LSVTDVLLVCTTLFIMANTKHPDLFTYVYMQLT